MQTAARTAQQPVAGAARRRAAVRHRPRRCRAAARPAAAADVQLLTPSCDPALTARCLETFGESFAEDPVLPLLGVPEARKNQFFRAWSAFYLQKWTAERVLYAAEGGDAAAIVAYSSMVEASSWTPLDALRCGLAGEALAMPWSAWPQLFEMLTGMAESGSCLEPLGIAKPYLKIVFLASHPSARGRGLGDAVMRAITRRADSEGLPLFLEAAPTGVDAYYESRHGFERVAVSRMEFGAGGFEMPLMLRRPRSLDG
ncbi:hypothetical protein Rsub_13060 [Raphidocelis subcapitata]|uniref:N-acetyltransferase domain-containing protein n=1 Tax=Raphidocelis subcapitata TaxID=307507 RepID=A0A2V0PS16_9CHLO|nr:hypothetical protein Rsub_13060 [Raphidocelis subcapitata]|eukprot:GBG00378.1 hypothetical protein Rsub_13060 [Raphidocelis subcapitata]